MLSEWWNSLSVIMRVVWGLTLSASLVFIIQTVMTFIGADTSGDFDAPDGDLGFDASSLGHSGMNLSTPCETL